MIQVKQKIITHTLVLSYITFVIVKSVTSPLLALDPCWPTSTSLSSNSSSYVRPVLLHPAPTVEMPEMSPPQSLLTESDLSFNPSETRFARELKRIRKVGNEFKTLNFFFVFFPWFVTHSRYLLSVDNCNVA